MGNCWSYLCGRCGEEEMDIDSPAPERPREPLTDRCGEEETNLVSPSPERTREPLTVGVVESDLQAKQNPMESTMASTSMAQTSTAAAASSESQKPPRTLKEVQSSFGALNVEANNVDELISLIRHVLEKKCKQQDKDKATTSWSFEATSTANWSEWVKSGAKFLEFASGHIEKMQQESGFSRKVIGTILDQVGHLHWAVGGLSIVAYLLENYEKMSANQAKCQKLLERMVDLAIALKKIYLLISKKEDEKLKRAIMLIAEGSMKCSSQMHSTKIFSFLKTSVDNEDLNDLKEDIDHIYNDLTLEIVIATKEQQPVFLPLQKPSYPDFAVGLEEPVNQITEMLKLEKLEEGGEVMVIYGFGGIGKTTLANAVVAKLELKCFNYNKIEIHEDPQKNDFKSKQEQLLRDVFSQYQHGRQIILRDCEEEEELLPEHLEGLCKRSRILLTARDLSVTDLFEERGLSRRRYRVEPLADKHGKEILCNDPVKLEQIKDDLNKILQICGGIPLALKIVGAQLKKQKYRIDNCNEILQALEEGKEIKKEHLSERLVNFVYKTFETSTQKAFLDICSVLYVGNFPRRWIEYIVGVTEVATLEEAALITAEPVVNSFSDINESGVYWEGEEELFVHDVIRAIGLSIDGGSRIVKDARSLCGSVKDQKVIKGVMFPDDDYESTYRLEESQLSYMSNSLRVFGLAPGMAVSGRSSDRFRELRYLVIGGDIPWLPVNFEALPRLAFYEGPIFKQGFKLPKGLRYLKASAQSNRDECATSEESNPIQTVQNSLLQQLSLSQLKNLPRLLEGIHQFIELKILSLNEWDKMEELPDQVCQLLSLNKLMMWRWESLKLLPESFSNLTGLTHLDLSCCYRLEGLCSSFGELRSLRYLCLYRCEMLTELPYSFGQLITLEYLELERCTRLTILPDNFGKLTALKCLDLYDCHRLKELPFSLGELRSLQELDLRYCDQLEELPLSLEDLRSLKILG